MHELGIVFHMCDLLEDIGRTNELEKIGSVTLRLGEVTGVIDSYLLDCWKWACSKRELLRDAELHIEPVPALTHCESCGDAYPTLQYGKTCPHCGSSNTYLIQGNEIEIDTIEAY